MTQGLHRAYGSDYLHFITTSCYQRRPILDTAERRDLLLKVLERVRKQYRFDVVGHVAVSMTSLSGSRRNEEKSCIACITIL